MSDSSSKKKTAPKKAAAAKKAAPKKEAVADPRPQHYTVGKWKDLDHYQCSHCPWSTLNEEEMIKHVAEEHLKMPSVVRTDTGFVTPTGDKIIREEVLPPDEARKEV